MDDFSRYETMWKHGTKPVEIYLAGKADGLDAITLLRLLRQVCRQSLVEAKETSVVAEGRARSLSAYQEQLLPVLDEAFAARRDTSGDEEPPPSPP
jgi:hypothetical protein